MAVKPKLALIPSGYKASKVYSVLPSNGVGDFDFTRAGEATRINKDGLIETVASNVPRLNYPMIDGVVSGCPSLLLEPERRNLIQYSEDFENYFNTTEITLNSNYAISPDGTQNANKITFPTESNSMYKSSLNYTGTHTVSFYVKGEGSSIGENFNLRLQGTSTDQYIDVPITEEWVRVEYQTEGLRTFEITNRYNTTIGTGSLILFGFQLEAGSFPTSYIPNYGTALGVTRSSETCNNSGDVNTFNDSEGVLMAEISALDKNTTDRRIAISDGTTNNRIMFYYAPVSDVVLGLIVAGGSTVGNIDISISQVDISKLAISYKSNEFKVFANGFLMSDIDVPASLPTGLNTLEFAQGNGTNPFYGNTKQIQYFDTALTDTDLEELTSWKSFNEMANALQYTIL